MLLRFALLLSALTLAFSARASEVPRVIIGLHDAPTGAAIDANYLYTLAEMPLNHLGLVLEFHNLRSEVPAINSRRDVRGILIWLNDGRKLPLKQLTQLVRSAAQRNIPVVFIGNLPNGQDNAGHPVSLSDQNALLEPVGVRSLGEFIPYTYNLKTAILDKKMVEFERKLPAAPPATESVIPVAADAKSYLAYDRPGDEAERLHTVVLTGQGGYVAAGFSHFESKNGAFLQWYLNPFAYFAAAFHTASMPVPDATTLAGRRIFYSHIDGDGWGSVSTADKYAGRGIYASEVILHEVAEAYPDLPVTVAPIAADIDPAWAGTLKSQQIARAFFRRPNVEPASHTYTHPFEWGYFGKTYRAQSELQFAKKYSKLHIAPGISPDASLPTHKLAAHYDAPRAYGDIPFSLKREIEASVAYIDSFCPPGKRVRLLQWSGDTSPTEGTVAAVIRAGLLNLNARDTRFDGDMPSYAGVSPIGKNVGPFIQISASHANENVYTDLWQGRFFGFRYLVKSLANTEKPIRVKPVNVYYHMYSGEKQASLAALKEVLDYASRQDIAPVTATQFAAIGQGFYTTRILELQPDTWRIENRGALDTLRFDSLGDREIDPVASNGILGARTINGVLYVALDPANLAPVLKLRAKSSAPIPAPQLVDSRWSIRALKGNRDTATFDASGYGPGTMSWRVPRLTRNEQWQARIGTQTPVTATVDNNGIVHFALPRGAETGVHIEIRRADLRPALL